MTVATPKRLLYHRATMHADLAQNTDRSSKTTWMIACEDAPSSLGRGHSKANENPSQSAPNGRPNARRISRRLVSHRLIPYRLAEGINHLKSLASLTRSHSRWIAVLALLIVGQHANAELRWPDPVYASEDDIDIIIDGELTESEWMTAQVYQDFSVISPDTLEPAPEKTEMFVLYTERGMYVGARMEQAKSAFVERLSSRDDYLQRDRISVSIDASGEGLYAYWFAINLGGTMQDGTILPERQYSNNWDGPWQGATARGDTYWTAEFFLPWTMMTLPYRPTGERTIGLYFQRAVADAGMDWGSPALPRTQSTFLSVLPRVSIKGVNPEQQFTFYPYASATLDEYAGESTAKAGFDFFWRPTTAFQITSSIAPDFGNVESDEVVVNLTSYETFFSEKRPFFLEGQEIFSTSPRANPRWGPGGGGGSPTTLINTRRIGAPPKPLNLDGVEFSSIESNQPSELLGAAKVTGQNGALRYGVLTAIEDDTKLTGTVDGNTRQFEQVGRDFIAARVLFEQSEGSGRRALGALVTEVDHPVETARTAGIDAHFLSNNGRMTLDVQTLHSDVEGTRGDGIFADLTYRPKRGLHHKVTVDHFDDTLDINDFGFLRRNDFQGFSYSFDRRDSNRAGLKERVDNLRVRRYENTAGEVVREGYSVSREWRYLSNNELEIDLDFFPERFEDKNSGGNGSYLLDDRFQFGVRWSSNPAQPLSVSTNVQLEQEDIGGMLRRYTTRLNYQPSDRVAFNLSLRHETRTGWLLYSGDQNFTRFQAETWRPNFEFSYFLSARQQARISLQWVGIKAFEHDRFVLPGTGQSLAPVQNAESDRDFTISRMSFQARYRWELAPLSDLFVVYTRGSNVPSNIARGFGDQFSEAWKQALVDTLVVKLRYRLGN